MSVVSVVCCQVEVSVTSWSFVHGESYRLWCVVVCDLETSWMRRPWPTGGLSPQKQTNHWEIKVETIRVHTLLPPFPLSMCITLKIVPESYSKTWVTMYHLASHKSNPSSVLRGIVDSYSTLPWLTWEAVTFVEGTPWWGLLQYMLAIGALVYPSQGGRCAEGCMALG